MKKCQVFILFALMFLWLNSLPDCENIQSLVKEIFQVPSPTGYEEKMTAKIIELLPEETSFKQDNLGSLYVSMGKGEPVSVFLTGMDEYGYFVSSITSEGYLNLDRAVRAPHPLFDSLHFGHPMLIHAEQGVVKSVLALPSLHILSSERRRNLNQLFVLDNAYLDIGARSKQEVINRGIKFLDPVTPLTEIIPLSGEKISGYSVGRKICTALLLDIAIEASNKGLSKQKTVVWLAQSLFPVRGSRPPSSLGAVRAGKILGVSRMFFLDIYPCDRNPDDPVKIGEGPVLLSGDKSKEGLFKYVEKCAGQVSVSLQMVSYAANMLISSYLNGDRGNEVVFLGLPVKAAYTPSETVSWEDIRDLQQLIKELWSTEDYK